MIANLIAIRIPKYASQAAPLAGIRQLPTGSSANKRSQPAAGIDWPHARRIEAWRSIVSQVSLR